MPHCPVVRIEHADNSVLGSNNLAGGDTKLFQYLGGIAFSSQFLAQFDQHVKPREIRILELQVFFLKQFGLPFDLLRFPGQLNKDRHL
ncbi:MAG: hypothetical protein AUI36_38915 [Cyanobacteria bacterium 13_1_40CM_2_61_4]|nr:MAG: hypothetical protein AUI36_38915 [Cyanobacteria bacterium 13_1_40CM_2_61_4]